MLVFGLLRPSSFFSATNLNAILVSQSGTAILALAVMVPLATKQFDLSIGHHLGMARVLIVGLQVTQGLGWPLAAALILLASLVVGFVNGLSVTFFRIDSFIATMGAGTLLYGVTNWYTNGEQIPGMSLPDSFTSLTQIVHAVPLPTVHVAIIAVAMWIVTERPQRLCHRGQRSRRRTHRHQRRSTRYRRVCHSRLPEQLRGARAWQHPSDGNSERWSRISSAGLRGKPA
jgi:ribose transport system permease protein